MYAAVLQGRSELGQCWNRGLEVSGKIRGVGFLIVVILFGVFFFSFGLGLIGKLFGFGLLACAIFFGLRFFGFSPSEQLHIRRAILHRFEPKKAEGVKGDDGEKAVNYIHREIDRQINKVRGILTFDGILLAVVRLPVDPKACNWWCHQSTELATFALLLSIILSLYLFLVRWGGVSTYDTFYNEFDFKAQHVEVRTVYVNFAVAMAMLAACAAAVGLFTRTLVN